MRGDLGAADPLFRSISNRISALEEDVIIVPKAVKIDDLLWKFRNSEDPKPILLCEKEELLEVVQGLLAHIRELDDKLVVQEHSKQALLSLIK